MGRAQGGSPDLALAIVQGSPDFGFVAPAQIQPLLAQARVIRAAPGELIWRVNDLVREVYVPEADGLLRIGFRDPSGATVPTAIGYLGHLVGEVEVFAGITTRFNEAEAMTALNVVQIPAKAFTDFVWASPMVKDYWLLVSNVRHSLAMKQIYAMSRRTPRDRLHSLVCIILEYMPLRENGEITLPFKQEILGRMADLSRTVTSQVLHGWKAAGLIDILYQKIVVKAPGHFRPAYLGGL